MDLSRLIGIPLIFLGLILVVTGIAISLLPKILEIRISNPWLLYPIIKRDGVFIGISPILLILFTIMYILLFLRK